MNYNISSQYSSYTAVSYSKTTIKSFKEKTEEKGERKRPEGDRKHSMDTFEKTYHTKWEEKIKEAQKAKEIEKAKEAQKSKETEKVKEVELSDNAKKLLEELKKKYGNMDFFIANYSTEAEAQSYLTKGTKEISVLMSPETLEEMANSIEAKEKYEAILDGCGDKLNEMLEALGEDKEKVKSLGISVDSEGNVSYFAQLDGETLRKQSQMKDFTDALDKNNKAAAERTAERRKKERMEKGKDDQFVNASSIEELLQKIKDAKYQEQDKKEKYSHHPRFDMVL